MVFLATLANNPNKATSNHALAGLPVLKLESLVSHIDHLLQA